VGMNNTLIKQGIVRALGVYAYALGVAWFLNNAPRFFGNRPTGAVGFSLVLMLFMVSALVTASIVLWSPARLMMEGKAKQAGMLLLATGTSMAVLAIIVAAVLIAVR
jgi:hypothetical protein